MHKLGALLINADQRCRETQHTPDSFYSKSHHDWEIEFWKKQEKLLAVPYYFSPQWETVWEEVKSRYKREKARLKASHHNQIELVDAVCHEDNEIEHRNERYNLIRKYYKEMPGKHWNICPLSIHLDRFFGLNSQDRLLTWKSALSNWDRFQQAYKNDLHPDGIGGFRSFQASLSPSQKSSYLILSDWWISGYSSPLLTAAFQKYLQDQQNVVDIGPEFLNADESTLMDKSLYHSLCSMLFFYEFNPQGWEEFLSGAFLQELQKARYETSCHAVTQRFSYSLLHARSVKLSASYPVVVLNDSALYFRNHGGKPYYLWDSQVDKTIESSLLPDQVDYLCISHTWGRWKKTTRIRHTWGRWKEQTCLARIPGIPWLVPENDLYEVRELPKMLKNLSVKLSLRYLWFDLFCIPQDGSQLADDEIGRQTAIFKGSHSAISWHHDVDSWTNVQNSLTWLGLRYLADTCRLSEAELESSLDAGEILTQFIPELLMNREKGWYTNEGRAPVRWFSSLWTLQEAILCPNLHLYTRHWICLEDRDRCPISLASLMVLLRVSHRTITCSGPLSISMSDPWKYEKAFKERNRDPRLQTAGNLKIPLGAQQIWNFAFMTRLGSVLFSPAPAQIFAIASTRQCTSSRVTAIMSAIGATDWYTQKKTLKRWYHFGDEPECCSYPQVFLQEVLQKYGARFYLTGSFDRFVEESSSMDRLYLPTDSCSLVPFSYGVLIDHSSDMATEDMVMLDIIDHEAVKTWAIKCSGQVRVLKAGIRASSAETSSKSKTRGHVTFRINRNAPYTDNFYQHRQSGSVDTEDLNCTLREIAGSNTLLHAVTLFKDIYEVGIVLYQKTDMPSFGKSQFLEKVGNYKLRDPDLQMPPTTEVNWYIM